MPTKFDYVKVGKVIEIRDKSPKIKSRSREFLTYNVLLFMRELSRKY